MELLSRKDFEKVLRRFGLSAVEGAIGIERTRPKQLPQGEDSRKRSSQESAWWAESFRRLSKGTQQAWRELFGSSGPEDLYKAYLGVSESATIPRQTPRAGITPGGGTESGSRASNHH